MTSPSSVVRVIFLRHGEALGAADRCIGHTDLALSPAGAESVRLVATELATIVRQTTSAVRLVSSDLRRAHESALLVGASIGLDADIDPRLREMDFGDWDGRTWADLERDDGDRLQQWMDDWLERAPPDGECVADLGARAASWCRDILDDAPAGDSVVITVAHAGWIRAAICHLLARPIAEMFTVPVDYASATIVDVGHTGPVLIASNVHSFDVIAHR